MKEPLLPVEEALARVLASAGEPMKEERIALSEAFGRTLARDLVAKRTQPPFANSAMDGYAVRAGDCALPLAKLKIIGESAAGRAFAGTLGAGQAIRIFTGAPIPEGADAVVIQEDAQREGDGGWGEHLITVSDEEQDVGTPGGKRVGKTEDGEADGLGHTRVGVGVKQALDARLNGEAVALDFFDGGTEVGREMGAENEDGEVDFRVHGEFAQRPVEVAIVCAGGGDDADATLGAGNTH